MADLANLNLGQLVALACDRLVAASIPNAVQESRWLLQEALNITSAEILAWPEKIIPVSEALAKLDDWLTRRINGEPLQYILGSASFYGRNFFVSPDVLIPRPDTELLIDAALSILSRTSHVSGEPLTFLDFGTGSGCIAITLLLERPDLYAIMVDASPAALRVASKNLERYGLRDRARLLLTQSPDDIKINLDPAQCCELVISNPPYIPTGKLGTLQREVQREPRMALDGGFDGMDFYRSLLLCATDWLVPGGSLVLEIGDLTQAAALVQSTPSCFTFEGFFANEFNKLHKLHEQEQFNADLKNIYCGIWRYQG